MVLVAARALENLSFVPASNEMLIVYTGMPAVILWALSRYYGIPLLRLVTVLFVFYVLVTTCVLIVVNSGGDLFWFMALTVGQAYVLSRLRFRMMK